MKAMPNTPATKNIGEKKVVFLGSLRRIWLAALIVLFVLCATFSWTTRDAMGHLSFLRPGSATHGTGQPAALVDTSPWLTAQALTPLAVSREEKQDAHEAERLADHDVDQAFAAALRRAGMQPPRTNAEAVALTERVRQLQALVKQDQALVSLPTVPATAQAQPVPDSDDVQVAKAQLGLDTDELTDAQQDLARATGDDRTRIQQELAAHEAMMQKYDSHAFDPGEVAVISTQRNSSLVSRISAWFAQRTRRALLLQAAAEATGRVQQLTAQHNVLEAQANAQSVGKAAAPLSAGAPLSAAAPLSAKDKLSTIKLRAAERQLLSIYDDRIQTEQQMAVVYTRWAAQVVLQHRIVLHLIVQSIGLIALILLCQYAVDTGVRYWTGRPGLDQRRQHTLHTILRVGIQILSLALVLIVLFGKPQQLSTILGLATAGLTVALQSYILGFCGWFVLMGRNGIRVGDTVEINGVTGEVAEIGLFRTMLLETGNWTAKGHPTGRLVAFMNTFAVTGQYFNFSTVGQWMWDEITVTIPPADDTYSRIEAIHQEVLKQTEADATSAEAEWKRSSGGAALSQFAAKPTINLRPAASGVDVVVRYVTRASSRFETRNCLYQAVLDVLHQPQEPVVPQ
jgi:small-conductance mechanosensitive channel